MVDGAAVSNRKEIRKLTSEHIGLFIFFFLYTHFCVCSVERISLKIDQGRYFYKKLLDTRISFQAIFDMMRAFKKCCIPLSNKKLFY